MTKIVTKKTMNKEEPKIEKTEKKDFKAITIFLHESHWNPILNRGVSAGQFIALNQKEYDAVKPYESKKNINKGFAVN